MRKIELIIFIICIAFVEKSHLRRDDYTQHHDPIKIGGLFDGSQEAEFAFKYAVTSMNNYNQRDRQTSRLKSVTKRIDYGNEFSAASTVCNMIENGVVGIVGPSSPESAIHVRNLCDAKEIPLIETRIDGSSKHVINLHPSPEDLGRVYLDLIVSFGWERFTIVYQDAPWLPLVEYILKNYNGDKPVTVRQLDLTSNDNYRAPLRRVKLSSDTNIVLCSSIEALPEILKQAQQVGLMTDQHQFIITSLDMHTIDLEPFQYGGTNITGVRLINPEDKWVKEVSQSFREMFMKKSTARDSDDSDLSKDFYDRHENDFPEGLTAEKLRLETALTYDAVMLYSQVIANNRGIRSESVSCDDPESFFQNGTSIFNTMKTIMPFKGLSGDLHFDHHGNRENFQLDVLELASEGLKKVGVWNFTNGISTIRDVPHFSPEGGEHSLKNKTLLVLTVINPPYGMLKETLVPLLGNDMFEGFGIELIQKLSEKLGFNYTFKLQEDKKYGNCNPIPGESNKCEWNGMLRELMDDRADLAITDLTITAERESAVDFTMPFMTLGISIIYEKPKKDDPELFSFMQPFSGEVWMCLCGSFFLVSTSLFVMGRLSPDEWDNPYPCIEEPEVLENQFSFKNSMWFTIGALLQQGSEIAPKAPSTRIVASMWWFFTLIMVSSYTANLAAFLTIENPSSLIKNVEDLYNAGGAIPYGAKIPGSTYSFFKDSQNEMYQNMGYYMSNNTMHLTDSNEAGLDRAKAGKYAFFMESSTIEYMTQRNCEVVQVGNKLDEKGYGIAMKKNSPYRGVLSEAILQMQESGEISRMKTKWWQEKRGGGACGNSDDDGGGGAEKLDMRNVGGVFVVVFVGCLVATGLGLIRWFFFVRRLSKEIDIPFKEALIEESKFVAQFGNNTKIVPRRKSSSHLESVNGSNGTQSRRSRSSAMNAEPYGIRLSLKNINKGSRDDNDLI